MAGSRYVSREVVISKRVVNHSIARWRDSQVSVCRIAAEDVVMVSVSGAGLSHYGAIW